MSKHFTVEFKQEAIKLVTQQGYTQAEVGKRLGISSKNISRWLKELSQQTPNSLSKLKLTAEQEEIQQLRKENQRLRLEKEILKKAAAFFANESK